MDFSQLPAPEEKTAHVQAMFDTIAPRYELVNRLVTFGLDARWRRQAVDALALPEGSSLLDLASGTGDLARLTASRGFQVIGADLSLGMLKANGATAPKVQVDAGSMPFATGAFDGLVCGYALRNFTDLPTAFAEIARVVRPGGRIALLDVDRPQNRFVRAGFNLWFDHAVPAIGGLLSDRGAYRYLPRSTTYLPPAETLREMVAHAGFSGVNHRRLSGGLSQLLVATRRGV